MSGILIWSPNYTPELTGIPPLVTDACGWLATRGHEVEVVTALPNYPQRRIDPAYRGNLWRSEVLDGVEVHRSWLRVRQGESFVDKVLTKTGKSKVDLVGHSQGGMMPRWYIQFLGGASKVRNLVALAPSNQGTTMSGIANLATLVPNLAEVFVFSWCESCKDQIIGSAALTTLNAGGGTSASVKYTNILTNQDEIVTPYTNGTLSGANVTNIIVQDGCSIDKGEHLAISYDQRALWYTRKALGSPWYQIGLWAPCTAVVPLVGG